MKIRDFLKKSVLVPVAFVAPTYIPPMVNALNERRKLLEDAPECASVLSQAFKDTVTYGTGAVKMSQGQLQPVDLWSKKLVEKYRESLLLDGMFS